MDLATQLDNLLETLGRIGIEIRKESLGGSGGGLCSIRGKRVFFDDLDTDAATRADRAASALASLPEVNGVYLAPEIREWIERART
jgi:hypothetical protein